MSTKNEQLFIVLSRVTTLLHRNLEKLFCKHHLTSTQFSILEVLHSKGDLCVKDIQQAILSTAGNVPVVINNLEKLGYVTKKTDQNDKRITRVSLTPNGKEKVAILYPLQQELLNTLLSTVDAKDTTQLLQLLLPLYRQLKV